MDTTLSEMHVLSFFTMYFLKNYLTYFVVSQVVTYITAKIISNCPSVFMVQQPLVGQGPFMVKASR